MDEQARIEQELAVEAEVDQLLELATSRDAHLDEAGQARLNELLRSESFVHRVLRVAKDEEASDIFLVPGAPRSYKKGDGLIKLGGRLMPDHMEHLIAGIYDVSRRERRYESDPLADDDFSVAVGGIARFRVNVYHQRNSLAAVIRIIKFGLPQPGEYNIPEEVMRVASFRQGLVLVTGPTGSGKSTTLACVLDQINRTRQGHIVTVENPIEFVHRHEQCIISQREIATDVESYEQALTSALREHPDTIMFGEMRTRSVIEVAMRAAETGQLMLSSLHTLGAAASITRIIDTFPAEQQNQARTQLAQVLEAVISQKLIMADDGMTRIPVFEIMFSNPAIRNLIRENKIHQIDSIIQANSAEGMRTYDSDLIRVHREGLISRDTVLRNCIHEDSVRRLLH